MKIVRTGAILAAAAAAGPAVGASPAKQTITGPEAVYWMSASTTSGMGAMGPGAMQGGRRPSLSQMMGQGGGGMGAASQSLVLQLGSSRRPPGPPQAEHDPPPGLGVGPMLPLLTPQAGRIQGEPGPPAQYQQPKGRMLIFWGCGEHAGAGQPLVLDLSNVGPGGQGAGQFAALARGLGITPVQPPSPGRNATYGEWPNQDTRRTVPVDGSLQGQHRIKGNYSPEIAFSLAASQDFLPPIRMTGNAMTPSGAAALEWRRVDGAQGYAASMFGSKGQDQTVMWTSSSMQASAFAVPEYLSDAEISRLVGSGALMGPAQTSCVIPVEAVRAAGNGFFNLVAYGGETNLSYPERPPAPKPWNIAWQVKVRYRSSTGGILGMSMEDLGSPRQPPGQRPQQRPRVPNPFNPFGR